jgi:hypothetical protein
MIVECPRCESQVDAKVLATHDLEDEEAAPWRVSLAACPLCGQPLLGSQELVQSDAGQWEWSAVETVWPVPARRPHPDIPDPIRESLEEAHKCWKARAFSACAVMVGRALEALCIEHTGERTLARGLRALRDQDVLDGGLYAWSESLGEARNLGSHTMGQRTTEQDAKDLLDFAMTACEYVYVFSRPYAQHLTRRAAPTQLASRAQTEPIPLADPAAPEAVDVREVHQLHEIRELPEDRPEQSADPAPDSFAG